MNIHVPKSIHDKAMLASLTIKAWGHRTYDRSVTREVAAEYSQDSEIKADKVGRYNKVLVTENESPSLAKLTKLRGEARREFYRRTLPWQQDGTNILPAAGFMDFSAAMRAFRDEYMQTAEEFCVRDLPVLVGASSPARRRLGSLFDEAEYPTTDQARRAFGFDVAIWPLPHAEDFRVTSLGAAEVETIKAEIDASVAEEMAKATRAPWQRVYEAVKHMSARLHGYNGNKNGSFHASLVGNIADLADLLPALNVAGDPDLDAMARRLKKELCQVPAKDLRKDNAARASVAGAADSILDALDAVLYERG